MPVGRILAIVGLVACSGEAEVPIGASCFDAPCEAGLECSVNPLGAQVCVKGCDSDVDCEGPEVFRDGLPWTTCADCPGAPAQCLPEGFTCGSA